MILDIEHRMSEKLGTEVELKSKKISISYHDTDDLNRILEALGCIEASESEK
jgi:ParB family chromosome partitioning protein